ncbi:MAG: hypothetical protein RIR26_362 [Pseudomonadota bacterium]|jgi:hypothetical protein
MKELVERELDWIFQSPVFYSSQAPQQAAFEKPPRLSVSLPGPLVAENIFEDLNQRESSNFLLPRGVRNAAVSALVDELPHLHTGRLGLIFEKYIETVLLLSFGNQNVRSRWPVREKPSTHGKEKTWGEFDFLFLNSLKARVEHWECSIKFYLQIADDPRWNVCWGPGVVDRLDLKGSKTFLQQLPLSSTQLGQQTFPEGWRELPLVKKCFAKGTLFYFWNPAATSFEERLKTVVLPEALSSEHQKSWWIRPEHVDALEEHYPDSIPVILPRRYWMTGLPACELASAGQTWAEFKAGLGARLHAASERKECLFLALYKNLQDPRSVQFGFIAAEHFLAALATHAKSL